MADETNMGANTDETTNSAQTEETKPQGFTQEEVNRIISERLTKEREANVKKYGDYDDLKAKCGTYEKELSDMKAANEAQIAELQSKAKEYEISSVKMRIALETGLPYDLAQRLQGETEDDIRKDAESLANYAKQPVAPPRTTEQGSTDPHQNALREMVRSLKMPN